MAEQPAGLARLSGKGQLAVGYDADFSIFAPEDSFVVDAAKLKHRNPITPYDGKTLSGVVRRTFLRGHEVDGRTPGGQLLRRGGEVVPPEVAPAVRAKLRGPAEYSI
mgnify:CR=1 FL=1